MKIIAGGQSGVDRAALDAALGLGLAYGGWVPKGRMDEFGRIPDRYDNLKETESADVRQRTTLNVEACDAALVVTSGVESPGTDYTVMEAARIGRPVLEINLAKVTFDEAVEQIRVWIAQVRPEALNVAGPRHSEDPELYAVARRLIECVLRRT